MGTERAAVTLLLPSTALRTHRDRIGQLLQRRRRRQQQLLLPCCTARQLTAVAVSCLSFVGFETTPTYHSQHRQSLLYANIDYARPCTRDPVHSMIMSFLMPCQFKIPSESRLSISTIGLG